GLDGGEARDRLGPEEEPCPTAGEEEQKEHDQKLAARRAGAGPRRFHGPRPSRGARARRRCGLFLVLAERLPWRMLAARPRDAPLRVLVLCGSGGREGNRRRARRGRLLRPARRGRRGPAEVGVEE